MVKLLREKKDALILGRQVGNAEAGEYVQTTNESGIMYRHNADSFKKMWNEVGKETGTEWRVETEFVLFASLSSLSKEERNSYEPGIRMLKFSVFREYIEI